MSISKLLLLVLVVFQQLQFNLCEDRFRTKNSRTGINSHAAWNRQQKHKVNYYSVRRASIMRCSGDQKKCGALLIHRKILIKEKRRCCKSQQSRCEQLSYKQCETPKCFKRQSRKCLKQFRRCNKKRITGRRPLSRCVWRRILRNRFLKRKNRKTSVSKAPIKKKSQEICRRSDDCEDGLCCARHNHVKICKPLIQEGQVCTKIHFTRKRSPEMFERCPCAGNLVCSPSKLRHNTCQIAT